MGLESNLVELWLLKLAENQHNADWWPREHSCCLHWNIKHRVAVKVFWDAWCDFVSLTEGTRYLVWCNSINSHIWFCWCGSDRVETTISTAVLIQWCHMVRHHQCSHWHVNHSLARRKIASGLLIVLFNQGKTWEKECLLMGGQRQQSTRLCEAEPQHHRFITAVWACGAHKHISIKLMWHKTWQKWGRWFTGAANDNIKLFNPNPWYKVGPGL